MARCHPQHLRTHGGEPRHVLGASTVGVEDVDACQTLPQAERRHGSHSKIVKPRPAFELACSRRGDQLPMPTFPQTAGQSEQRLLAAPKVAGCVDVKERERVSIFALPLLD
jgi:hypothetical protein